jgi:hypothetical protein
MLGEKKIYLRINWVSEFCSLSEILNTTTHNISHSDPISVFRSGEGDVYSVRPLRKS